MAKIRARPETATLYFDFFFQGIRCREQTTLPNTPGNRRKMQAVLDRLTNEIKVGSFEYARYFPNSKLATRFADAVTMPTGENSTLMGHTTVVNAPSILIKTPLFRNFAKEWYTPT